MTNDNIEAQLSQNKLESIANQTNVSTSPQINVGKEPVYISYFLVLDRTEAPVYVANRDSDTVSVINPYNNTVKTIPVGNGPTSIDASSDIVYVANEFNDTVSVISSTNNTVVKNIPVGNGPRYIAPSTHNSDVYVANRDSDTVSVINLYNNTVKNIPVGDGPTSITTYIRNPVYVTNEGNDTVSVIDSTNKTVVKNITVGNGPTSIAASSDFVYVANEFNDTVSVISSTNNTVVKNITVGNGPRFITAYLDFVYVANYFGNTVSVINPTNNTVVKNIPVGNGPRYIATSSDFVYVTNEKNDTVSVINRDNNTITKNIPVGHSPSFIAREPIEDSVYVANSGSGTVSVIDPATNKVVAGMTFDSIPFRGGQIICDGLNAPINRYFYVSAGTECVAKPNGGYEFGSWVEILDDNSTRTINASIPSDWLVDPVAAFRGVFTDDPAATLTVNKFGSFTAYFTKLPDPVPAEFTASIITVVVASIIGSLLIPAAVGWYKSKKQTSILNSFYQQMTAVHNDDELDESDDTKRLTTLNKNISDSYAAGKISNDQYTQLKNEVSAAFHELFKKRIESITGSQTKAVDEIKNETTNAYNDGKLNNEHYTNLKDEISNTYQRIFKKRIESITDTNIEAFNNIKNDIEDAYSDRKITELDYNLLIGKISRIFDKK